MPAPEGVNCMALSSQLRSRSATTSGRLPLLLRAPMRRMSYSDTWPLRCDSSSLVPAGCHASAMTSPCVRMASFFSSDLDAAPHLHPSRPLRFAAQPHTGDSATARHASLAAGHCEMSSGTGGLLSRHGHA